MEERESHQCGPALPAPLRNVQFVIRLELEEYSHNGEGHHAAQRSQRGTAIGESAATSHASELAWHLLEARDHDCVS